MNENELSQTLADVLGILTGEKSGELSLTRDNAIAIAKGVIEHIYALRGDVSKQANTVKKFRDLGWQEYKALKIAAVMGVHCLKNARMPGYTEKHIIHALTDKGLLVRDNFVAYEVYRLTDAGKRLLGVTD